MGKIQFTNIIIDDFSIARKNTFNNYVHFLTHIHTDHLKGLSNTWEYGKIYCSKVTKQLISLKFPKLYDYMTQLQIQVQHTIKLSSTLQVTVTLFDANHCPGAVMVLIQGYMGTVLYTGDIRFDRNIFKEYTYLYPHNKRSKQFKNCSKQIDYLHLDNTFLHPKFTFPPRQKAIQILDHFIQEVKSKAQTQNRLVNFYIGMDMNGKEQVLVHLAEHFQTLIVISQFRFNTIRSINFDCQLFTTDPQKGFIHVVPKSDLKDYTRQNQNTMGIILTGWANSPHYRYKNVYAIPYSLHSSYNELKEFVDSIHPSIIQPIVPSGLRNSSCTVQISGLYQQISYTQILDDFRQLYCSQLSPQLLQLRSNIDLQKKIKQRLGLDRTTQQINMQQFGMKTIQIQRPNNCTGFKLDTSNRNQQQLQIVRRNVRQLKKKNLARKILNNGKNYNSHSVINQQKDNKNNNIQSKFTSCQMQREQNQNNQYIQQNINQNQANQIKNNAGIYHNILKVNQKNQNEQIFQEEERVHIQNLNISQNQLSQNRTIQIQDDDDNQLVNKKKQKHSVDNLHSFLKQSSSRSRNKFKSKQVQTKLKVKKPLHYVIDDEEEQIQNGQIVYLGNAEDQNTSKMKKTILQYEVPKKIPKGNPRSLVNKQIKKAGIEEDIEQIQFDNQVQLSQIIKGQVSRKVIQQETKKLLQKNGQIINQNTIEKQDMSQLFNTYFWKQRNSPIVKDCKGINIFQIDEKQMNKIKVSSDLNDLLKTFKGFLNMQ